MAGEGIVVIGASAGGIEALCKLVGGLSRDLPTAICIVVHTSADNPGVLPRILDRDTSLIVAHAVDGEPIRRGHIYVAPPDQHLLLKPGKIALAHGPKENGFRPAIDPLFRTAVSAYGPHVVGVLLSGGLDDGVYGLALIKNQGGITVVQDIEEALVQHLPQNALENVQVDHVLKAAEIGLLLNQLAHRFESEGEPTMSRNIQERDVAEVGAHALESKSLPGAPSGFVCPECGGVLWELHDEGTLRYQCHVGHAYAPAGLVARHSEELENVLWTALRTLEENAALHRRMADQMRERGLEAIAANCSARVEEVEGRADVIRNLLLEPNSTPAFGAEAGLETDRPNPSRPSSRRKQRRAEKLA